MTLELYHYVHCPYCVRVRFALGFLQLDYSSHVVAYDDSKTPVSLTGVKMLPILSHNGRAINESLDIIKVLDSSDKLQNSGDLSQAEAFIKKLNNPVHSLAMPYWIYTPEFTESSRKYFVSQKEAKRGPFKDLVHRSEEFKAELEPLLTELGDSLKPFFESNQIRIQDIIIAAHLWGLYIVPEFQFPANIHAYLQRVKKECNFNYHQDYWR